VSHRDQPLTLRSIAYHAVQSGYKLWGVPYNAAEKDMASLIYIFYVSKIYEFMDTFIMLLKGNVQQARD
jgi:elongation of very long chain fatty acids protein 4